MTPAKRSMTSLVSYWLAGLVFLSAATLLVGPYIGLWSQHLTAKQPQTRDQVAIPLHPHIHSSRGAKTLRFDWTVTTGLRSPDGVEKLVYLVNGESATPRRTTCVDIDQESFPDQPLKHAQGIDLS